MLEDFLGISLWPFCTLYILFSLFSVFFSFFCLHFESLGILNVPSHTLCPSTKTQNSWSKLKLLKRCCCANEHTRTHNSGCSINCSLTLSIYVFHSYPLVRPLIQSWLQYIVLMCTYINLYNLNFDSMELLKWNISHNTWWDRLYSSQSFNRLN